MSIPSKDGSSRPTPLGGRRLLDEGHRVIVFTQYLDTLDFINAPLCLGIGATEEILVTFNGELADRHPPTAPTQDENGNTGVGHEGVRLLTWGDPYLTGWLEAIRGNLLSEQDYENAELKREGSFIIDMTMSA